MRAVNGNPLHCYRRRIVVIVESNAVRAGIEDDVHHFQVDIVHDGDKVVAVEGAAIRFPWVTCPGASTALQRLCGAPIATDAPRRADDHDRFNQCTHQLELALLAIAQAARGVSRTYDVAITDPDTAREQSVTVHRDGAIVEHWQLRDGVILSPEALAGTDVRALRPWTEALDDDRFERIAILRRCLQVADGRVNSTFPDVASDIPGARNACYAFQDVRAADGRFIAASVYDFSDRPDALLADFR